MKAIKTSHTKDIIRNISYKELIHIHEPKWKPSIYPIRNISYKELIQYYEEERMGDFFQLEIYPIRNWYGKKEYPRKKKNLIRNISYKELIRKQEV